MNEYSIETTDCHSGRGRKLTGFLRWAGSVTLAVSAISFLLQGLEQFVPGYRNWVVAGFIVILCGCGLICGYVLKETRGARLFFGLATAFLTVQYSQIATFMYHYFEPLADASQTSFSWWQLEPVSLANFALIAIASLILTLLVVPTGFSLLARSRANWLSLGYLLGNVILMLPTRDNMVLVFACTMLFAGLRYLSRKYLATDPVFKTVEGFAASAVMWLPLAIVAGRGLFYPENWSMIAFMHAMLAVFLLIDLRSRVEAPLSCLLALVFGTLAAVFAWLIAAQEIVTRLPSLRAYETLWMLLPLALLLHLISYTDRDYGSRFRAGAALLAGVAAVVFLLETSSHFASLSCMLTGIFLAGSALNNKEKLPLFTGVGCFSAGVLFNLKFALDFYETFPWASSGVLGLLILLLASYIDSREQLIRDKSWKVYQELRNWG